MECFSEDSFVNCNGLFCCRVAGTVGAIVTCPLEVVKTRQQSSNSGFHHLPQIAQEPPGGSQTTCRTVYPAQRRRLWTTTRHSRPQVVALSGYVTSSSNTLSIVQCLKHIIKYEGPMALFKGKKFDKIIKHSDTSTRAKKQSQLEWRQLCTYYTFRTEMCRQLFCCRFWFS